MTLINTILSDPRVGVLFTVFGKVVDCVVMILGPCLICLATGLISYVCYLGFGTLLPLRADAFTPLWFFYGIVGIFLLLNILFNYFMCVTTNPGTPGSAVYEKLVDDARANGQLPQPQREQSDCADTPLKQRNTSRKQEKGGWMNRGPLEWSYDKHSGALKPPRSHYCHVSKKLVLNMDHYCPWMFNCVGFANYRYFVLFLLYMWPGCMYEMICAATELRRPHRSLMAEGRKAQHNIMFLFVLTLSVGIAVSILLFWHLFLVLTAQTTIEFYGNFTRRRRARTRGEIYRNPYDVGYKRNWRRVFGNDDCSGLGLMPSRRPPQCKPWPEDNAIEWALQGGNRDRIV